MKKIFLALLIMMSISSSASAEYWSTEDTNRELVVEGLLILDYVKTDQINQDNKYLVPDGYVSTNINSPYYMKQAYTVVIPNQAETNFILLAIVAHPIILTYIDPEYRKMFQYVSIGVIGASTAVKYGINFSWPIK